MDERIREPHRAYNGPVFKKEIHCECGKLLAKIGPDGKIKVWCKACRKEVPLLFVEQTADAFIDWFNSASDEEIKAAAGK